jgi:hypothetical protein
VNLRKPILPNISIFFQNTNAFCSFAPYVKKQKYWFERKDENNSKQITIMEKLMIYPKPGKNSLFPPTAY